MSTFTLLKGTRHLEARSAEIGDELACITVRPTSVIASNPAPLPPTPVALYCHLLLIVCCCRLLPTVCCCHLLLAPLHQITLRAMTSVIKLTTLTNIESALMSSRTSLRPSTSSRRRKTTSQALTATTLTMALQSLIHDKSHLTPYGWEPYCRRQHRNAKLLLPLFVVSVARLA